MTSALMSEPLDQWATARDGAALFFHGTAVLLEDKGVLILGPSGSGKSSLALHLMALGATLIADDGVCLHGGVLMRPETAPPWIEARGIGLLNGGPLRAETSLDLVVDLAQTENDRLPPARYVTYGTRKFNLIRGGQHVALAPIIVQIVKYGCAQA